MKITILGSGGGEGYPAAFCGCDHCNAARAGKKALCICSVSDSFVDPSQNMSADARRTAFTKMMEIALEVAEA